MTPVRVILPSFAGGGAERIALMLLSGLDRDRFRPELIVFHDQGPLADLVPGDVAVLNLTTPRLRQALPKLIKHLRGQPAGIVFSTLGYVSLPILACRGLLPAGTQIVTREANMPSLSLPNVKFGGLLRWAYRTWAKTADLQICTSTKMQTEFQTLFGVAPERLAVLYNPVDEDRFRGLAEPVKRHPGKGLRFIAAGRMTRQKGFDRLLDAFGDLPPDSHLNLLGEGPELAAYQAQVAAEGLEDRVAFLGFERNPWAWFAGADAVLIPSRWEGLCNVGLEALAVGTPIIATPECGGIEDIAKLAEPGAVTIAAFDRDFVQRCADSPISNKDGIGASLLPNTFQMTKAQAAFNALLAGQAVA